MAAALLSTVKIVYEVTTGCTNTGCHDWAQLPRVYNKCVYLDYVATSTLCSLAAFLAVVVGPAGTHRLSQAFLLQLEWSDAGSGAAGAWVGRPPLIRPGRATTNAVLLLRSGRVGGLFSDSNNTEPDNDPSGFHSGRSRWKVGPLNGEGGDMPGQWNLNQGIFPSLA